MLDEFPLEIGQMGAEDAVISADIRLVSREQNVLQISHFAPPTIARVVQISLWLAGREVRADVERTVPPPCADIG